MVAGRTWKPPAIFNFAASLVALCAAVGLAYMAWLYYEYSPWTRDGRVRVYTVEVAPEVSGTVVSLPVQDLQFVHKGDVLFKIDPGTYQNDLTQAEGRLGQAKATADYLSAEADRRQHLTDLSVSQETRQNAVQTAQAARDDILAATGSLDQASLNLHRTTVHAPVNGWVTDLLLQQGGFASAGKPAMTMINADSFWVAGYFEETQLARIKPGDEARLDFMAFPGHPATGRVRELVRGISVSDASPGVQGLPSVNPVFTWVRLAQRIPVYIDLEDVPCPIALASGMTVTVTILDKPAPALPASGDAAPARAKEGRACPDSGNVVSKN